MPKKAEHLVEYHKKRDFSITPEPKGKKITPHTEPIFVIQKHHASHLHYDLRLEMGGVLKSWAVPKGPPKTTTERRLAMETEDHPMEYAQFEGTIPQGEYGAGTVKIWDSGTFENIKFEKDTRIPLEDCYKKGTIEVRLNGTRLQGNYALIKMKNRKNQWLMIKMKKKLDTTQDKKKSSDKKVVKKVAIKKTIAPTESITANRHIIAVTHSDKIIFPKSKITKGDLVDYYHHIAPIMVPLMKDRVVSMHRFPDGIDHEGFYQKEIPDYFPSWITRYTIPKKMGGAADQVVCNNAATLVYLANQLCLTPHIWLSKVDKIDYPDRMIFDFDPPDNNFELAREGALALRPILEKQGLHPYVMTTGAHGLHVVVPLRRTHTFDQVRACARVFAEQLIALDPKKYTIEQRLEKRGKRVFIDILRNAYAQTGVAPYAVRALEGASVATPIDWKEVADTTLTPTRYTIFTVHDRLKKKGNPWRDMARHARAIPKLR